MSTTRSILLAFAIAALAAGCGGKQHAATTPAEEESEEDEASDDGSMDEATPDEPGDPDEGGE